MAELGKLRIVTAALFFVLCVGIAGWRAGPADSRTAAKGVSSRFFGVNFFGGSDRDTSLMRRGGIGSARFKIDWGIVEPSPGSYQWNSTDAFVALLAARHISALPFAAGLPGWVAASYGRHAPTSPAARRAWARFLAAIVHRYGPGGSFWAAHPSLPSDPIRALQVWNEPNFPQHWGGRVSPHAYAKLLHASAKAIRRASSNVKVVLAGLGPGLARRTQIPSWRFLSGLYQAKAKRDFDIAADQPYAPNVPAMADQLRRVARVMRRHHDHAPLYVTEIGWSSGRVAGSHLEVGPHGQAKRVSGALRFCLRHVRSLHIKRFYWFAWRDPPASPNGISDFGLRHYDYKPKPAWRAYVRWSKR